MNVDGRWIYRVPALALGLAFSNAALANPDVEKQTADAKNWAMQAGDMYNQRYSKLTQINAQNVGKMQVAWMFSTGVLRGHEGSPLVVGDTMYLHTPFPNKVFALDIDTPNDLARLRATPSRTRARALLDQWTGSDDTLAGWRKATA